MQYLLSAHILRTTSGCALPKRPVAATSSGRRRAMRRYAATSGGQPRAYSDSFVRRKDRRRGDPVEISLIELARDHSIAFGFLEKIANGRVQSRIAVPETLRDGGDGPMPRNSAWLVPDVAARRRIARRRPELVLTSGQSGQKMTPPSGRPQLTLHYFSSRGRCSLTHQRSIPDRGAEEISRATTIDCLRNDARPQNRRVTVSGKLDRFGSALVYPPIFIEAKTIKGK